MAAKRTRWKNRQRQGRRCFEPKRLIFLDETGLKTNMTRSYGWGPRGQRVVEAVSYGHWNTTTLVQAVDVNRTRAAMMTDGAMNTMLFNGFLDWLLVPKLRPGDVVVMDNLSCHHNDRVAELIHSAGARIEYLPPYSPDLNPIENLFSKIKSLIRSAAVRTQQLLEDATADAISLVSAKDCRNCFRSCGYRLKQT